MIEPRANGADPSPMERSGTFTPGVIEDIQIKAELARYRIRGFGILRPRTWATFDDLTFVPGTLTRIPLEGYREKCRTRTDRKSTRLNSSHSQISYAVFCLKKKKKQ